MQKFLNLIFFTLILTSAAFKLSKRSGDNLRDDEAYLAEAGDQFEGDIAPDDTDGFRNMVWLEKYVWPNGVVPYTIGSEYDSTFHNTILAAMRYIESKSCLKFVERKDEAGYAKINKVKGCHSQIAYTGKVRKVSLTDGCYRKGTIIHELLHLVGFFHEQARPDRDDYVDIFKDNIKPGQEYNFKKLSKTKTLGTKYDYGSIMHYEKYTFSKSSGTLPTILPKDRSIKIGQRDHMSDNDIKKLDILYKCNGKTGPAVKDCKDYNTNCSYWSSIGECQRNPSYMNGNCAKSCKLC